MIKFLKLLKYERFQDDFVYKYIDYINKNPNYYFYLRHQDKHLSTKLGCFSVELYDVLDNCGFDRLIKAIHELKKDNQNYEVECNFRKSGIFKIQYIRPLEEHKVSYVVARVKFRNDNYIHNINILYTLLNNTEVVVQYEIELKKIFYKLVDYHDFIYNNIMRYSSGWYFHSYADKKFWEKATFPDILQLEEILWGDILQGIIYTLFYTNLGQEYKLPIVYNTTIKKYNYKVARRLKNPFLTTVFENDAGEVMWLQTFNHDRVELFYFSHGRVLKKSDIYRYFMDYGMEFYFFMFHYIEEGEIEKHVGRYFNSNSYKQISIKEQKWLMNKLRSIDDRKRIITLGKKYDLNRDDKWKCFVRGKNQEQAFVNFPERCEHFKEKYDRYLKYFSAVSGVHYNHIIFILTIAALIVSIISIIVAIVLQ